MIHPYVISLRITFTILYVLGVSLEGTMIFKKLIRFLRNWNKIVYLLMMILKYGGQMERSALKLGDQLIHLFVIYLKLKSTISSELGRSVEGDVILKALIRFLKNCYNMVYILMMTLKYGGQMGLDLH